MTSKTFFMQTFLDHKKIDIFSLPALLAKLITHPDLWAQQTNHTSL